MGSFKIKRLPLKKQFIEVLEKEKLLSCKDVLSLTRIELQNLLGINYTEAIEIQRIVSNKCVSNPATVFELYLKQRKTKNNGFFQLSLHALDILLQGGIPIGSITELSGPPGVGKTQFAFMLSILATLPASYGGLDGNTIYIDTESAFCAKRLSEMAQKRFPHVYSSNSRVDAFLQNINVHRANSTDDLKEIFLNIERDIIKNNVKLVIVDSITSLMRKEYGANTRGSLLERNQALLQQAAALKEIAQVYGTVIFLTNQITSHSIEWEYSAIDNAATNESYNDIKVSEGFSSSVTPAAVPKKVKVPQGVEGDHVIPALGNTWAHCVNTRLVAQFLDPNVRQLTIAKSPVAPNASVRYILDESGIVLTDDDIELVQGAGEERQNIRTKYNFLTSEITGTS